MTMHKSDSLEQRSAEDLAREWLSSQLGQSLTYGAVKLSKCSVQIDGYNEQAKIACEIYCRVGKLKGSQPDKIASDILKLVLVEREIGGEWTKVICFVDNEAAKVLNKLSWLSTIAADLGVQCLVAPISDEVKQKILLAQNRQKMVNAREELNDLPAN